ncbi:nucleotide exchange factor GrpE [Candidatus Nitronereus thalassa]|uniref:Protein GrpE n=1 Tax=Candidatus Nitronereus thalassa TaxID=3020898 RepID=A0ABU3K3Y1_9BACT|nr:nucleotide exchange factor GrpE [Candidatus Nitronereus thalassa]MDT7041095.1 nucleotide exchange factor GrpE [Candidatus Nitronereus thalassa]
MDKSDERPTPNESHLTGENQSTIVDENSAEETTDASTNEEVPTVLQSELTAKMTEIQELNDKYLRLAAEFENYKRRAQRDQSETVRFANEKLLKDLLPTIDNLERALQCSQEKSDTEGLREGVELTYKQFLDTLEKVGVKQVTSAGEPFDPAKHQAVGQVESSTVAENFVVDEYQKGYFLQDRILRPAMVTVAKTASTDDPSVSQGEESHEQHMEGEQE